jgi:sugar phosphate isomerase/epimerase
MLTGTALSSLCATGITTLADATPAPGIHRDGLARIKTSLNAYSFNRPLRDAQMTLAQLLEFTAECGFDAIDITGYYFPGYPAPPQRSVMNAFKRHAFLLGLDISGTGVRNDFTVADATKRKADIALVKQWIEVSAELGAPALRVFAGRRVLSGPAWQEAARWVADSIQTCAESGREFGVMLALQNHGEFLQTADQVDELMAMINSDWAGLMLDIGSYLTDEPYLDIRRTVRHAITWQVKENVSESLARPVTVATCRWKHWARAIQSKKYAICCRPFKRRFGNSKER